ncbi:FAD-dependent oxidoreductase, partial [Nostoc sp. NIES-2111]
HGGAAAAGLAVELSPWSRDIVLLTDGAEAPGAGDRARLAAAGVSIETRPVERLVAGADGRLAEILFRDGTARRCDGLFHLAKAQQRSSLVEKLGCDLGSKGTAKTSEYEKTNVPGIWVAGDASRRVQWAIVAAAEGALAAFAVNTELTEEDVASAARSGEGRA